MANSAAGAASYNVCMTPRHPVPVVFEPEYLEGFRQIFEEKIVFNQTLGLKLTSSEVIMARMNSVVLP